MSRSTSSVSPKTLRSIILAVVSVLAVYVILSQLEQFKPSVRVIQAADTRFLFLGFCSVMTAVSMAALTYRQLIFKPIPFIRILYVQYAGMFVNRLLPAGIGGVSLFIDFLYRHKHSLSQASTVAAVNNTLGFVGHMSILACTLLITTQGDIFVVGRAVSPSLLLIGGITLVLLVIITILLRTRIRHKVANFLHGIVQSLRLYRSRKLDLTRAYLFALGNTLLHVLALHFVLQAFAVELSFASTLLVLTGGVAAATITPTPGGVLGAEAGITAALLSFGVPSTIAIAVALSYRLISYWLPLIPGVAAFLYVQKGKWI